MKQHKLSVLITGLILFSLKINAQEEFRKIVPSPGPAPKIEIGNYKLSKLSNGLQIIVVENHKLPRVSFQLFVDVPLHLERDQAGVASIAGSLLSAGTNSKTKAQIDESVDFIGASLNSSGNGITASSLSKHADVVLDLMSDILFHANFPKEEFDKLVKQTLSSLSSQKEDPAAISSEISGRLRYGSNHPYGESTTEKTIQNITVADCIRYKNDFFKPGNSYLIVVGDITQADALAKAEKYFGNWKKGSVKKQKFEDPLPPNGNQVYVYDKNDAVQTVLALTYPLNLEPGAPDITAVSVMNQIFGGGSSSRLFKNIREDKGYTYGAYSSISPNEHIGYFTAGANVRNSVTDSALTEFLSEMNSIREGAVSTEELSAAKAELSGRFGRSLEQPTTIAGFALNIVRYKLPADYYNTYLQRLSAVDAAAVKAMALKYIRPDKVLISAVGKGSEISSKLSRFDSENKIRPVDNYGNPLIPKLKMETTSEVKIDPSVIIDKYLTAIGGKELLATVKDVTMEMSATIQGMQLTMKNVKKDNRKLISSVSMNNMTLSEQIFDGTKGKITAMGQPDKQVEGSEAADLLEEASFFPELSYQEKGVKLELLGNESINGTDCFKVLVTDARGKTKTDFFAVDSGLKLRTSEIEKSGEQEVTVTREYDDYKPVSNILFPHKWIIKGAMPVPLNAVVSAISVNSQVSDDLFILSK
jgi:predicted Zn-dependent peptidase